MKAGPGNSCVATPPIAPPRKRITRDKARLQPYGVLSAFEDPDRSALSATVFWRSDNSAYVLPLHATTPTKSTDHGMLDLAALECPVTIHTTRDHAQHVLIAEEGRRLQLLVRGCALRQASLVLTPALVDPQLVSHRLLLLRRLSDLVATKRLRPSLYPSDLPWRRLSFVLQALDGRSNAATYRDIAVGLFGAQRVGADWADPRGHLRDRIRRAMRRGSFLIQRGYLDFLR